MKKFCCVGYVKPMNDLPRIYAVNTEVQKQHICEFAEKQGFIVSHIYIEDSPASVTAYRQMCEDAVHREFDLLIIDTIYCFGSDLFAAADFIENVMLPTGFKLFAINEELHFGCPDFAKRLSYSKSYMRSALAAVSQQKNKDLNIKSRRAKKNIAPVFEHDLKWYETRQIELFRGMLQFPENFDELEEEMKFCRTAIKKLRV